MGTDVHSVFQKKTAEGWEDIESEYPQDRHYTLFAWIGNVRNGFGFAGVPTHNRIEPLSDNRGFPDDFKVVDEDRDPAAEGHLSMWMGDHSHSWLSADEILAAEPPRILRTGVISIEQFRAWDGNSSPNIWCGSVSGPGVVVAGSPSEVKDDTSHVRIGWFEDTKESFAYFVDEVRRLKELHGEVRFVFGFDS